MTSSFAAQLSEIAAKSNNELDLKAQKNAHSQSLIFEKRIASSQDFETIFQLCLEGFEDLCKIDPRFRDYQRNLFSEHSKTQERDQMTADQNATLDTIIEACLGLLGGRLLLSPAVKVAEWLVRRFRVHEYNTSFLLLTFLPYHATPIFRNLLSIISPHIPPQFKFLGPYISTLTNPPRHAIAYGAINNDGLFSALNTYALQVCQAGSQHQSLLSFWASVTAEAITGRLDLARSGRKEIQRQRQEDVLLKVLPLLKDGLSMHDSSEMVVACFTFTIVLISKCQMSDKVLGGLMEAVTGAMKAETMDAGLICLSLLTQQKSDQVLTKRTVVKLAKIDHLEVRLQALDKAYEMELLAMAMIQSAMLNIRAKELDERLGLVERLLLVELLSPSKLVVAISSLLTVLTSIAEDAMSTILREAVAGLLRRINDTDRFTAVIADAVKTPGLDQAIVESRMQIMIEEPQAAAAEVDEMDVDSETTHKAQSSLSRALEHIPQRTVDEHSFLSHSPSHLFQPLLEAFILAAQSNEGMQSFLNLPLWSTSIEPDELLSISFFVRVFSGPYAVQVRQAALSAVGKRLFQLSDFDSQAILPYVLLQLADPAQSIRQAAAEVLLAVDRAFPSAFVDGETFNQWDVKQLYGSRENCQSLTSPSTKDVSKIMQRAVLPVIEECILDSTQIRSALENALVPRSSKTRVIVQSSSIELKKYLRQGFFHLILMHIISTPLYSVRIGLLVLLTSVDRVGVTRKQKELMPLLLNWASLTPKEVEKISSTERLDIKYINSALCGIVSSTENNAVESLLDLTSSSSPTRLDLVSAASERIQSLWKQMKPDQQVSAAESLLNLMFHVEGKVPDRSQIGTYVFESVELSTDVLNHLLNGMHFSMADISEDSPASKRRRKNDNQAVATNKPPSQAGLANIRRITFILELVDNSNTETRPELLGGLFHVLDALHQLKLQHQSDLGYLLSLSLSSLLSIFRNAALHASKVDLSAIRLDVILDCMRTTTNSQVQNAALLLISAIASIAPQRVLDNIMPVFTFMGTNLLGKEDDYSSYVVDQTMDKVIPPLIESLRSKVQDLVDETDDLVTSFAVAFEHIPHSRRLRIFKKLVSSLDDETFLWVIISSLTQRYPEHVEVLSFIVSLINTFDVELQLKTCASLLALIQDALANQSDQSTSLIDSVNAKAKTSPEMMVPLLRTINKILTESNMRSQISKVKRPETIETDGLMPLWEDLLGRTIRLMQTPELDAVISALANNALSSLLSLVPIITLFDVTERFVNAGPELVSRKVLRLLESRLHTQPARSLQVQTKAISFLQTLYRFLEQSEDVISKHAAIACVDRICEIYGRKDIPAAVHAARVISGDSCLGSSDTKIHTLTLLCLSSIVELVKGAMVPVIPEMMPKIFGLLQTSVEAGQEGSELHNAAYTLLSTLLAQVPFIISEEYLDLILVLSAESVAEFQDSEESNENRKQALQLISKNVELGNVIGSLQRTWAPTVENDVCAVQQALSLLTNSVKISTKSAVMKNADKVSAFLLQSFDLRRVQFTNRTEDSYTDKDVSEIENAVNHLAIEIIYKLNDTTFRPIFLHFIDWATKCPDLKSSNLSKAQTLRKTTLFNFLTHFFNTLKSIVTSYATHVADPAIEVLKDTSTTVLTLTSTTTTTTSKPKSKPAQSRPTPDDLDTLPLYLSALSTLHAALTHDADAHFSTPSLFNPLSSTLTSQLHLAFHPTYTPHISSIVIPTIVALATAVVDTPDHLKTLNSLICALRRAENREVRRASVQLHLALAGAAEDTSRMLGAAGEGEGEGIAEEWCGTVLSVGEGMVYVNEMLEDEDEVVEAGVRRLVRRVREVVGEEGIFE